MAATNNSHPQPMRILIGVTGSVATIKLSLLVQQLRDRLPGPIEIRIVTTERGRHFIPWDQLRQETILDDNDEWAQWTQRGDPVLHIEVGGRGTRSPPAVLTISLATNQLVGQVG